MLALQRSVGNRAVSRWVGGSAVATPGPGRSVQRVALQDGPPLAPGNYRYDTVIVGVAPAAMTTTLTDMAAHDGLPAERAWQQAFVADMRAQSGKPHSYEDPDTRQTISVEPMLASRAEQGQTKVDTQVGAVQTQFQQELLGSVRGLLSSSEKKLQAEGHRYGFPDDESIFRPRPVTAGASAIQPSLPESKELSGAMDGAKKLLDGKKKVKAARDTIAKSGPILGDAMRPTVLEPALREYHELREATCKQYPILASVEGNDDRLAELAGGSAAAAGGATGPTASIALVKAKEEIRKELADKLSNISYVRDRMTEPDKIVNFWLDRGLRENTKRSLSIAPSTIQDAAVEDKVKAAKEDAEFEAKLKQAMGIALLVASFIPGVAPVAGAVGLALGAADIYGAFQQYYWEQAAAGTAMEKAEAISQTDPSLFGLALSIAGGLLEGIAEAKALEAAIGVFKAVSVAYKEARAAAVVAKLGSGAGRAAGTAEVLTATEKLRTTADTAPGSKPGLGTRIVEGMADDVTASIKTLDEAFKTIKDPGLIELIKKSDKKVNARGDTLMDLATKDSYQLAKDFGEWQRLDPKEPGAGKPFEDWLRDRNKMPDHGILNEPAGLLEYGMDEAEAQRSFDAAVREDPTREAGVWADPETGEHVCVQGGPGFVEHDWMADPENFRQGKQPKWELKYHKHPNRGKAIDRLPSSGDFGQVTRNQAIDGRPRPVTSTVMWNDPVSGIPYQTEFGFTPGAPRPYWARYRVEDGSVRTATFADPPFGAGNAEYQAWTERFTGKASDEVPGGNVPPEQQEAAPPTKREGR